MSLTHPNAVYEERKISIMRFVCDMIWRIPIGCIEPVTDRIRDEDEHNVLVFSSFSTKKRVDIAFNHPQNLFDSDRRTRNSSNHDECEE